MAQRGPKPDMEKIALVRQLAAAGLTLSEMASQLGLSRQRIHKICQRHEIVFRRLKPYEGVRRQKP